MIQKVRDFDYDMTLGAAGKDKQIYTYTQQHRTYDRALATHNGYLAKIAALKKSFTK